MLLMMIEIMMSFFMAKPCCQVLAH